MLADLDAEWMANKPIGLFPLRMTTPEAVIPELQAIFGPFDPTGAEPSMIRFLPIARMNAVLAVGGDPDQMTEVEGWVRRLDRGRTVGMQFYVYYLKHAGAEDIAKLLNESFGGGGGSASAGLGPAGATTALGAVQPLPAPEEGIEPAPPEGGIPPSPPAVGGGEQAGAGGVKVVANKANNALLIRATPQDYEMVEATLRRLDTAPWQVLIEATIAEVALNDLLRYGVQYFIEGHNFSVGFNTFDDQSLDPRPVDPGFNFLFTGGGANITIDALSRLTDVKVLSSPSVVVLDNSEAVLTVGDEVPITTRQAASTEDITTSLNTIEYRDTGVILQVRPRINTNEVVSLEIAQEVSRVAGAATELTPIITQRKITSRVNVQSGQTVVLGGLIQESEDRGRDRVPILGEIPVVGNLFSSTRNEARRTELIVFITPRVIRNPQDARDVSEEIRDRLKALRPPQVSVAPPMPNVVPTAPLPPARPQPLPPAAMVPPHMLPDARPGPRPAAGPTPLTRPAAATAR
jgi:general secretion pathway protein D